MSQVSAIFGTEDEETIRDLLALLLNSTSGTGLIHESIHARIAGGRYTRSWFAWANSYFAEMIMDLAERKPELIFGKGQKGYVVGEGWSRE
jgi:meiotically up-regulated gene 157 (Mug157) protein